MRERIERSVVFAYVQVVTRGNLCPQQITKRKLVLTRLSNLAHSILFFYRALGTFGYYGLQGILQYT